MLLQISLMSFYRWGLTPACHVARAQISGVALGRAYESQHLLEYWDKVCCKQLKHPEIATLIPYCALFKKMGADLLLMSTCKILIPENADSSAC